MVQQMIQSPWGELPRRAPYVLPLDAPFVNAFNSGAEGTRAEIVTSLLPEPFFGNPLAPVVLLLLNPGIGTRDAEHHKNRKFAVALRRAICEPGMTSHFHLLDETNGPGRTWWSRATKPLRNVLTETAVFNGLFCVEFSPYHSETFSHGHLRLPSQQYSFSLVEAAMQRGAEVVCMRGERCWNGALPGLASYRRLHRFSNPRSSSISLANVVGFPRIVAAIERAERRANTNAHV
ncbi:hypothetical protein BH09PSE5_BH09PSE5_06980 [soil metagenome]